MPTTGQVWLTFIHSATPRPMAKNKKEIDTVFLALSDPTRRAVVEQLRLGPASVGELAEPHDMALPSFLEHLRKLETAGLITSKKVGRVRTCTLVSGALKSGAGLVSDAARKPSRAFGSPGFLRRRA
jgi:DNA-binding transcriptional ArsR family regulator